MNGCLAGLERVRRRWPLLAILCFLASLLVPGIASAHSAVGAENRVWDFGLAGQLHVGVERSLTLALHRECAPTYDAIASGSLLAARGGSKSAAEMADDLAGQLGRNRVSGRTAGGKQIDIDLRGKGHFDKATGQKIETPHVHEATINVGPNGKINLSDKITRPATKQDIRTARRQGGGEADV